jgi:versiconal hemiacetal acetate esterase
MLMTGTTVEQLFKDSEVNAEKIISRYEIPPPDTSVTTEDITLQDCWERGYTPPSPKSTESVAMSSTAAGGSWEAPISKMPSVDGSASRAV